ncbi:MAG TPA: response regulator [Syntrophales bacterium]|nr:response regulator [Syntrophales bacterium]
MRYLVIDDSPTMRKILINTLRTFGIEDIIEAGDGHEGLAKIYAEKVDFVITDWNMPKMNGLEMVKKIRADNALNNLPILMVTTRESKQDILQAHQAKVNNYIVKPFTPQFLKEKIDAVLMAIEQK